MNAVAMPRRSRLARFVAVGAGANLLLFVLSWLFRSAGMPAFTAGALAYALAFVAAYGAQRGWTFGSTQSHGRLFTRYLAAQIACAALSGLIGHAGVEVFALSPLWMSVAVTATAGVTSYLLSSYWVFAEGRR